MKTVLKLLAGSSLFFFLVFKPMRASLMGSVVIQYGLSLTSQAEIFSRALLLDPCEPTIGRVLGDTFFKMKNFGMAAVTYGNAMACSPGDSLMRFNFGETLFTLGYDGSQNIKDALKLEPNNPIYQNELRRIYSLKSSGVNPGN